MVSELHQRLENVVVQGIDGGKIGLFEKFAEIKAKASEWLCLHEKNGIEHSERLEEYLVKLTHKLCIKGNSEDEDKNSKIHNGEIFILLCAVYLHDIGYWHDGKPDAVNHPQRSHDRIINDPAEYLLSDFPLFGDGENRAAKAIALVCLGHSDEKFVSLEEMPKEFADHNLCKDRPLNLRMLAALLRLADETDDPYVRMVDGSFHALRSNTPLVVVGDETIAWHWKDSGATDPDPFLKKLEEKKIALVTAIDYLREIQWGNWYLVLHPQVPGSAPFMAGKPVETFVGREDDLAKIHDIIQKRRTGAVTGVVGTGGIGKTELARMYAERYQDEYPGGIFWASLKGSSWKNEAPNILAKLRPGADPMAFADDGQAREAITKSLDRKQALLVIDNVDEYDDIIKPACRVLVTTRNKDAFKAIPHDAVYRLDKLDMEAALKLLSKLLGPNRVEQDRAGAEQLVKILGGMPLALEISGCHLDDSPSLGFPEYIGAIRYKIERLTIEESEDKNILASLELSLEGLAGLTSGPELLDLFGATAVCATTGFRSKTLIAVAGLEHLDTIACEKLVGKLYHRSLLEYHEETKRYSLHALVRQMAEIKFRSDEDRWKKYTQNHCDYFVRYAIAHRGNLLKIIEESDGLWQAMVQTNQVRELQDRFSRLLEYTTTPYWKFIVNEDYELGFRYLVETNLINIDDLGNAAALLDLLKPLVKSKNKLQESSMGWVFNSMGLVYSQLGNYEQAIEYFERRLEIARRIGDVRGEGNALGNMGIAYRNLGEYEKAIAHHEQALEISRRIGDVRGEGNAMGSMGLAYADLGEYEKAIAHHEQALEISRRIGDMRGEGNALGNMGLAYADLGEYEKAIAHHEQALEISRRIGDVRGEGADLGNMGIAYSNLGEYEEAIAHHEQALEISRRIGDVQGEGADLGNMGIAYSNLGEYEEAIAHHEQALEISRRIGDVQGEGADLGNMGIAYSNLGEYEEAIDYYNKQLDIVRRIGDVRGEGNALGNMGLAYAELGNKDKARECFEASIAIYKRLGLDYMVEYVQKMMASAGIEED